MFKRIRRVLRLNSKRRYYLAGPISWVGDDSYITWREDMEKFLISIGHEPVNPLKKYAVPAHEKKKVEEMIMTAKNQVAREYLRRRIINADLELLERSDGVIAFVPGYSPGTCAEIGIAYLWRKPVYVVTSMPRRQWAGWFVGLSTLIFRSWDELKRFMRNMEIGV